MLMREQTNKKFDRMKTKANKTTAQLAEVSAASAHSCAGSGIVRRFSKESPRSFGRAFCAWSIWGKTNQPTSLRRAVALRAAAF